MGIINSKKIKEKPEFLICRRCLKPKENNDKCDYCSSDEVSYTFQAYTVNQWEFFINSLKGGAAHDFNPWEFDGETGRITRGDNPIKTGPTNVILKKKKDKTYHPQKYLKVFYNNKFKNKKKYGNHYKKQRK